MQETSAPQERWIANGGERITQPPFDVHSKIRIQAGMELAGLTVQIGLSRMFELMMCFFTFDDAKKVTFSEQMSSDNARKRLSGIFFCTAFIVV